MTPPSIAPESSRRAAFVWALRSAVVVAALALAIVGLERVILAQPARYGPVVDGWPTEALVAMRAVNHDVAFFGDSVVQTIAAHDSDTRHLPDIVAAEAGVRIVRISQAATSVDLHEAWLEHLAGLEPMPQAVVIPVNPRAFSAHWERNPPWVFRDVAAGVRHPLFARLASVLEWRWGRRTEEEFTSSTVLVNGEVVGTINEIDRCVGTPPERCAHDRYLLRYASDYESSVRIDALRSLVQTANGMPFPVVLYITPVDIEGAREVLTEAELGYVDGNLALLRTEIERSRWPTVDCSTMVHHVDFDHLVDDPHEHLRGPGRIAVAEAVAPVLREVLGLPPRAEDP